MPLSCKGTFWSQSFYWLSPILPGLSGKRACKGFILLLSLISKPLLKCLHQILHCFQEYLTSEIPHTLFWILSVPIGRTLGFLDLVDGLPFGGPPCWVLGEADGVLLRWLAVLAWNLCRNGVPEQGLSGPGILGLLWLEQNFYSACGDWVE